MNPRSVLATRAIVLRNELSRESKCLESEATQHALYAAFGVGLRSDIERARGELDSLIADTNRGESALPQARLARIQRKATALFGEVLALRVAGFIRAELDRGMCLIADKLLSELARAVMLEIPHLSTLAESDFFGASARIVRLRYPAIAIWDLPVLAHEFGHSFGPLWHVADGIEPNPQHAFLKKNTLGSPPIMDEYFCDLIATFLLGPAYVSTCILNRFDPTNAEDSETHPADLKRAWWILRGLELLAEMTNDDDKMDYLDIVKHLRDFWMEYVKESGSRYLTEDQTTALEIAVQRLFPKMQLALPTAAYINPSRAWGLVADYREGRHLQLRNGQFRDLLNAAWFARSGQVEDIHIADSIDTWARRLARSMQQ